MPSGRGSPSPCAACGGCFRGNENLRRDARFTGYHVNGGYAERVKVPEVFAHPIPSWLSGEEAARAMGCRVCVITRDEKHRELAGEGVIQTETTLFDFDAANEGLRSIAADEIQGSVVLKVRRRHATKKGGPTAWAGPPGLPQEPRRRE